MGENKGRKQERKDRRPDKPVAIPLDFRDALEGLLKVKPEPKPPKKKRKKKPEDNK